MKIKEMVSNSVVLMATMSDDCLIDFVTEILPLIIEDAEKFPTQMLMVSRKADTCTVVAPDLGVELIDLLARGSDEFYVFDAKHGAVVPVVGGIPSGGTILSILKTVEDSPLAALMKEIKVTSKPAKDEPAEEPEPAEKETAEPDMSPEQLETAFEFLELMERILSHD